MSAVLKSLAVTLITGGLVGGIVYAQSANIKNLGGSISNAGVLTVSYDVSGLGNVSEACFTVTADSAGCYRCRNNGGNFPVDPNKTQETGTTATSCGPVRNGRARGTIQLTPPASTLNCPGNQEAVLVGASYANATFSGSGVQPTTIGSGSFSAGEACSIN